MRRPYTVNDMLRLEGIGALQFSPDGKSIIFEYQPPYDERGLYGVDRGGQILQLSLSGEGQATPLFEHQPGEKYWLGRVSPDGRRVLVFHASRYQIRLGVYNFATMGLTPIDETPQVNERFERNNPIWINNHEIILSSRPKDWNPDGIRERPYIADRMSGLRDKAFAGESSVANVSTDPANHWFDGYLLKYNVDTKSVSVLGQGRFGDFTLSADGKKLAALRLGQRLLHFPVDQLTDYFRFDTQLYVFDLESGSLQSFLPNMHVLMDSLRWSGTGSKLSFFAWDHMTRMREGAHYVIDDDAGSVTPMRIDGFAPSWISIAGSGTVRSPVAAEWLQRKLIIHGVLGAPFGQEGIERNSLVNVGATEEAKWYEIEIDTMTAETVINGSNQTHQVHRFNDGRLLLQSDQGFFAASESGTLVPLDFESRGSIQILNGNWGNEIEDTIAFTNGNREVGFLDLNRNNVLPLGIRVTDRILAWAPDRQQVITRSDTEDGGKLYLQSTTKAPTVVFTFNNHLSKIEHPRWEHIEYRGADGVETFSCVLLPYNYDARKSYPTIVDIYPGTGKGCQNESVTQAQSLGSGFWPHNNNLLSANGYLVIRPSNTYGSNQIDGTLYGGLQTQVDAALDALVAAGMTDPGRIGIWGFSNGSMASLWLASVSNRYKAVVPMFGASSAYFEYFGGASPPMFQMYLGTPIVHLLQYESEQGAMPLSMGRSALSDPLGYVKASPLDRAAHICSPVMMVHSDLDGFTPFHYEALFAAMYRLGKRAELVRYYGEGHGLRSPGNIRDFYERVLAFFDKYVATGAPMPPCDVGTVRQDRSVVVHDNN